MIRVLIIVALILTIISLPAYFRLSKERRKRLKQFIILGIIALIISRFLPGFFALIIPLFLALAAALMRFLPVLIRYAPLLHRLWFSWRQQHNSNRDHGTAHSTIETRFLRIQVDQHGQPINGEVLFGTFSGRLIKSLDKAELAQLFKDCATDNQSMDLLQRLIRNNTDSRSSYQHSSRSNYSRNSSSQLTVKQAFKLLGLQANASEQDIIKAHRRLMQKNHPDRGGSAELAAQINQARDLLLNQ